jgi:aminopeptidase-like protein
MSEIKDKLFAHVEALFPICRSITGPGLRDTLRYIAGQIPLKMHEVPSGTPVLDWEIPREWIVRGAMIRSLDGRKIIDFADNNLHLLQYSAPADRVVSRDELDRHLHSLPEQPDLIPYRTAYYADTWGFCLSHNERLAMTDAAYRVTIDTSLIAGSLSYGECVVRGQEPGEFLLSVHCCHPSLANDNLSAIAVAIELARALQRRPTSRWTYRFLFIPGTIGAIAWLAANLDVAQRVSHGLVLSCLGDPAPPTYKRSRSGDALIDRYASYVLRQTGHGNRVLGFVPYGYDERQYCSPGFDLPVGCLMRSPNGTFPQYHTSADNLSFVRADAMADSLATLLSIVDLAEMDGTWINTCPYGEPQLGRRGLYAKIGGQSSPDVAGSAFDTLTLLWVLNLCDGQHTLLDIAERSDKPFSAVTAAARSLHEAGLLRADRHTVKAAARDESSAL